MPPLFLWTCGRDDLRDLRGALATSERSDTQPQREAKRHKESKKCAAVSLEPDCLSLLRLFAGISTSDCEAILVAIFRLCFDAFTF